LQIDRAEHRLQAVGSGAQRVADRCFPRRETEFLRICLKVTSERAEQTEGDAVLQKTGAPLRGVGVHRQVRMIGIEIPGWNPVALLEIAPHGGLSTALQTEDDLFALSAVAGLDRLLELSDDMVRNDRRGAFLRRVGMAEISGE